VQIQPSSPETAAKVVPVLVSGLTSPLVHSRRGAAETLGELGPAAKDALPALQKAAADEDKSVHDAAIEAIKRIGGGAVTPTSSRKSAGLLRGKLKSN
jgi:HEAT repeat protein